MRIRLEFYESPLWEDRAVTGRFMDEFVAVARLGAPEKRRIFEAGLCYLPELERKTYEELRAHLAGCPVWRVFGDLSVYRTNGNPCVVFTVVAYEGDDGEAEVVIHGLGAVGRLSSPEDEAVWERLILRRCRSIGLCDVE